MNDQITKNYLALLKYHGIDFFTDNPLLKDSPKPLYAIAIYLRRIATHDVILEDPKLCDGLDEEERVLFNLKFDKETLTHYINTVIFNGEINKFVKVVDIAQEILNNHKVLKDV